MGHLYFIAAVVLAKGFLSGADPVPDFNCPERNGVFAHPEDCLSYYVCTEGKPEMKSCSAPLHFNPYSNNCDWPISEKCTKEEYYSASLEGPVGPEVPYPIDYDVECDCRCRVPDKCHCDVYYLCGTGKPIRQRCPPGLHFNPRTQVCDRPENVRCNPPPECFPPTCPPPPETTTCPKCPDCIEGTMKPIGKDCRCYTRCQGGIERKCCCPEGLYYNPHTFTCGYENVCDTPTCDCHCCFRPDNCNCSKYYFCEYGVITSHYCPDGLLFDPVHEQCTWPHLVDTSRCCGPPDWTTTTARPPRTTTARPPATSSPICRHGDGHYPHPNCKKFYHCSNGFPYVKDCPAETHWSVAHDRCEEPCRAQCDKTLDCGGGDGSTDRICSRGDGHYKHPDCGKFYHCSNGKAYVKDCPGGLHWSVSANSCEWPQFANCK